MAQTVWTGGDLRWPGAIAESVLSRPRGAAGVGSLNMPIHCHFSIVTLSAIEFERLGGFGDAVVLGGAAGQVPQVLGNSPAARLGSSPLGKGLGGLAERIAIGRDGLVHGLGSWRF